MCEPDIIKKMHSKHAYSFEEALQLAYSIKGDDADVVVIPNGVGIIVK